MTEGNDFGDPLQNCPRYSKGYTKDTTFLYSQTRQWTIQIVGRSCCFGVILLISLCFYVNSQLFQMIILSSCHLVCYSVMQ